MSMTTWLAPLLALTLLPWSPARGAGEASLLLRDGSRRTTALLTFGAEGDATLAGGDGAAARLPMADIVSVAFAAERAPAGAATMTVRLHDGSRLTGRAAGGDEEHLQFELAAGGTLMLPLDAVRALFVGPRHAELDVERFAKVAEGDTLHRRVEVGGDHTRGTLVSFAATGVRFDYSLGTGDFRYDEVEAVILEQQVDPRAPGARVVEADLLPDGTLIGELVRLTASELVMKPLASDREFALPREVVSGLRLRDRAWRWLSDVDPIEVRELPYLGGPADFLYPWRRDRSVTGRPLECDGRRFGKGLGCHSRSELSFALPTSARRFVASVGLSDEVLALPERGTVEFRVLVDGVERFKSRILRGGAAAEPIAPLDVTGGKVLTLIADFGGGEDVADRAVWGEAVVLD